MAALRVAYSLDELAAAPPVASVLTLGVFDGVHRGHRAIIEEVVRRRSSPGIESAWLITFDPHPVTVTHSRQAPPILSTIEERIRLFEQLDHDLDGVFVVRFDAATAAVDYREFIRRYLLEAMDMRTLVLGYDCHFGRDRLGSPESVQAEGRARGFEVHVVPPQQIDGQIVSSTHIRKSLLDGDLEMANRLLGHPYVVSGVVRRGRNRGKTLGYPTANLEIDHTAKLWPPGGVYAVTVEFDGEARAGMMNVGTAPTIKGDLPEVEVHLFDFDADLYGRRLMVFCGAYLRAERRFPGVDALTEQLAKDETQARRLLAGEDGAGD